MFKLICGRCIFTAGTAYVVLTQLPVGQMTPIKAVGLIYLANLAGEFIFDTLGMARYLS